MIHQNRDNITIYVYAQNSTAKDRYSSSYGPAKLDDAMASFEVKTRRAITLSILVVCRLFLHENVVNDVGYHRAN